MTDRIHSLTVALESDMRSDDVEELVSAIRMLRGVLKVAPNIRQPGDWVADQRARRELTDALWAVLHPDPKT